MELAMWSVFSTDLSHYDPIAGAKHAACHGAFG